MTQKERKRKMAKAVKNKKFLHLGVFLETARVGAGFTQKELSDKLSTPKLGVHSQFVSNWERGLCAPPEHCFKNLRKLLKLENRQKELNSQILKDVLLQAGVQYKDLLGGEKLQFSVEKDKIPKVHTKN